MFTYLLIPQFCVKAYKFSILIVLISFFDILLTLPYNFLSNKLLDKTFSEHSTIRTFMKKNIFAPNFLERPSGTSGGKNLRKIFTSIVKDARAKGD